MVEGPRARPDNGDGHPECARLASNAVQQPSRLPPLTLATPAPLYPIDTTPRPFDLPAVPPQPTALIGRDHELHALCALLRSDGVRLVTLTGPPGAGKTRLGVAAAELLARDAAGRVGFVPLDALRDPADVLPSLASSLRVRETGRLTPTDAIADQLRGHRVLLVLDNFEQVLDAAGDIATLLARCPDLSLLITSRAPLHLRWEREMPVGPLPITPPGDGDRGAGGGGEDSAQASWPSPKVDADTPKSEGHGVLSLTPGPRPLPPSPAVRLFVERARAVRPDFALTDANVGDVSEICRRLDGLPLAIELAAARIKLLPPRALVERLTSVLPMLTGGARDLPARHQTMTEAIAWGYDLLGREEQALYRRLSVFAGGFTIEAAEAVALSVADEPRPGPPPSRSPTPVFDLLAGLVDASLVQQQDGEDGGPRYTMLRPVWEFARERLDAGPVETGAAERRHAAFMLDLASRAGQGLTGPDQLRWAAVLAREQDNCRAALAWTLDSGEAETGLRLCGALWPFWELRGQLDEGRRWMRTLLARGARAPIGVRAQVLYGAGALARHQGDYDNARALLEEALSLYRELGDRSGVANALTTLGVVARLAVDLGVARELLVESLEVKRALGDQRGVAISLNNLGLVASDEGDDVEAKALLEESVALRRNAGDLAGVAGTLSNLGNVFRRHDDDERARALYEEAMAIQRQIGDLRPLAITCTELAKLARRRGDHAEALTLLAESLVLKRNLGDQRGVAHSLEGVAKVDLADGRPERAARLFGAAEALRERIGSPMIAADRSALDEDVANLRAALGNGPLATLWEAGRDLTMAAALNLALEPVPSGVREAVPPPHQAEQQEGTATSGSGAWTEAVLSDPTPARHTPPAGLTAREVEVLRLIAAGRTNREIAAALVLTLPTVQNHLVNIYRKIDARGRSEATAYAFRHGLGPEQGAPGVNR
jgi:predicted ATPase/DNA-binding CsgD family transcriptional regulator/Tfp pilus assembly protein PilF